MGMNRIVIVGASLAGLRTAEALRREGFTGQLLFVGADPHASYDRPPLSTAFLAGRVDAAGIALGQSPRLEATWLLGRRAERLLASDRRIVLADGEEVSFDGLVIATGAAPRSLPGLRPLSGVTFLRTVDDGLRLRQMLQRRRRIAVLGHRFHRHRDRVHVPSAGTRGDAAGCVARAAPSAGAALVRRGGAGPAPRRP